MRPTMLEDRFGDLARRGFDAPALRPSEYVARQCVISTETGDPFVRDTIAAVGADHVVWASDFPHPEAPWPHAVDGFLERGLSRADEAAVLWSTPCALYHLDPAALRVPLGAPGARRHG